MTAAVVVGVVVGVTQFGGATVMVWACDAVKGWLDRIGDLHVKLNVPASGRGAGDRPGGGSSVKPGGSVPAVTDQVNGAVPPSTLKMSPNMASHSVPAGSGVHDICTAPTMFLFGCQPLKVLQINVTFVEPTRSTAIPIPSCRRMLSGSGARCGRPHCWRS